MKKIVIINLKGGVGKSVTACNLGVLIPMQLPKERMLVVDLDKQANTSKFFDRWDYKLPAVDQVLINPGSILDAIRETGFDRVDILPANMRLLTANRMVLMDCTQRQQDRLTRALAQVETAYDWCIMDCPPDIDMATINALCAADWVIIPVDCDEWALDGLDEIVEQIRVVQDQFNPGLQILGCLITRFARTNHSVRNVQGLAAKGLPVFSVGIRQSIKLAEAKAAHKPVQLYSPGCPVAHDYRNLCNEIVSKLDTQEVQHG